MKKKISPIAAIVIVLVVLAVCGIVYSKLPIAPTAPPVAKGANRPPPGTKVAKPKPEAPPKEDATGKAAPDTADKKASDSPDVKKS